MRSYLIRPQFDWGVRWHFGLSAGYVGLMTANPILVRAYLKRALGIWLATRAIVIATFLFAAEDPFHLPFLAEVLLVAISVVLCFADIHRRRERALLGNLTLGARDLVALFLAPAILGEVVFRTVVALL